MQQRSLGTLFHARALHLAHLRERAANQDIYVVAVGLEQLARLYIQMARKAAQSTAARGEVTRALTRRIDEKRQSYLNDAARSPDDTRLTAQLQALSQIYAREIEHFRQAA